MLRNRIGLFFLAVLLLCLVPAAAPAQVEHNLALGIGADMYTIDSGGSVQLSATPEDNLGHGIASWSWSDNGAGGTFSPSADVQNPTWTAPGNSGYGSVARSLTVVAICNGIPAVGRSVSISITENSSYMHEICCVEPDPCDIWLGSGEEIGLSYDFGDSYAHGAASIHWSDNGAGGSFWLSADDANCYTAPENYSGEIMEITLTVSITCDSTPALTDSGSTTLFVESAEMPVVEFPDAGTYYFSLSKAFEYRADGRVRLGDWISYDGPTLPRRQLSGVSGDMPQMSDYQIMTWSAAAQAFVPGNMDSLLTPGQGYIITVPEACSLSYPGYDYYLHKEIRLGWNLVGGPSEDLLIHSGSAPHYLPGSARFTSGPWAPDEAGNLGLYVRLLPTKAYWLQASRAGVLDEEAGMAGFLQNGKRPPLTATPISSLRDLPQDNWAYDAAKEMVWLGVSGGYSNDANPGKLARAENPLKFVPTKPVTRAQFAMFLTRAFNLDLRHRTGIAPMRPVGFSDVPASHWAASYVSTVVDQCRFMGAYPAGGTRFSPSRIVTRGEAAISLASVLNRMSDTVTMPVEPIYTDVPLDHPAFGATYILNQCGIFAGQPGLETRFRPTAPITRAELSLYIYNMLRYEERK